MRRILIITLITILAASLTSLSAILGLAFAAPFHPGQGKAFAVQKTVEETLVSADFRPAGQALRRIELTSRRAKDAYALADTPLAGAAFTELENSFVLALRSASTSDPNRAGQVKPALLGMLRDFDRSLARLQRRSKLDNVTLQALRLLGQALSTHLQDQNFQLSALLTIKPPIQVANTNLQPKPEGTPQTTEDVFDPHQSLAKPRTPGTVNYFFPRTGIHATLPCAACHSSGVYAGTSPECINCHAGTKPANHYGDACSACHTPDGFFPPHFNHAAILQTDCQSCHLKDRPTDHFAAQCSTCHTAGAAWLPANFDHTAVDTADCTSCHAGDKPANHFNAQCSACHTPGAWLPVHFDHQAAGAADCQSCHEQNRPANHYNGQCSACHTVGTAWLPAHFNHEAAGATNCSGCHSGNRPDNHYSGQCSSCHNPNGWRPANFNHAAAGATDCQSCHAGTRPANHFAGQCSQCHNTSSWAGATFNHTFPTSHGGANGQCATCHPSGPPAYSCFRCHNQSKLDEEHHEISNYASRCAECHAGGKGGDD